MENENKIHDEDGIVLELGNESDAPEMNETPEEPKIVLELGDVLGINKEEPAEEAVPEEEALAQEPDPEAEAAAEPVEEPEEDFSEQRAEEVARLEAVKEAMANLSQTEQACKEADKSLKAKQKELDVQRKRVEEKINSAVKKARSELEKGFDEEINAAEKAIKEAETQKKNAKAAAINERMKRENSSTVDENKVLTAEVKSKFRDYKVPAICRSSLYYSLFMPLKKTDYLICAAAIVLFAGVIPFIVTRFFSSLSSRILIWVLLVVVFAAIYFLISSWTKKGEKNEALKSMRHNVDRIAGNKKYIRNRNKDIKADPDESQYNLYEYDQALEAARMDYEDAKNRREAAVEKFENEDSVQLRENMEVEKAPMFQELEKEIEQIREDYAVKTDRYNEAVSAMEGYSGLFGEKMIKADKIDELISIISEGRAVTIQEALNVQKSK